MKSHLLLAWHYAKNIFSHSLIVDRRSGYDLAITSHSDRVFRVFSAIESACSGSSKPRRAILFLSKEDFPKKLPASLERLRLRGLEIIVCENLRPHKKQQPYLKLNSTFDRPLITIDDDVFYDKNLTGSLFKAWQESPERIFCSRARVPRIRDGALLSYTTWPLCQHNEPTLWIFATGVGGVLYPPKFLQILRNAGDEFKSKCPTADDVWINFLAAEHRILIQQISKKSSSFPDIPGSRRTALFRINIHNGGNDVQISNTYSDQAIGFIEASHQPICYERKAPGKPTIFQLRRSN